MEEVKKESTKTPEDNPLQELFNYMHEEHGLILLESELQEIIDKCKSIN